MNKEQFCKIYPALPTIWSYLINCKRCTKKDPTLPYQYIGHVCRTLRERCGEHRCGVENNIDESFPTHFNQPKYTLNDVQVIPLLHVNSNRDSIRLPMEQHLIDKAGALKTVSIELVTTQYSQFTVDFICINIVAVHTYHKHFYHSYFSCRLQT